MGEEIENRINQLHAKEWDEFMAKSETRRKRDKYFDHKTSLLVYYNEDISEEERERRFNTLYIPIANRVVEDCNAIFLAPKPIT
jgi:hypothetical protein